MRTTLKLFVILLLVIAGLLFIRELNYRNKTIGKLENFCYGNIAVVGNGNIKESDISLINLKKQDGGFDCVVRFNHINGFHDGDRFDIHASRFTGGKFPGTEKNISTPILPINTNNNWRIKHLRKSDKFETLLVHETYQPKNLLHEDTLLFEGCENSEKHSSTGCGPSSGAAVIDYLTKCPKTKKISVFGMNWNGTKCHVDFKNKNLVRKCCKKCIFYKTADNNY